MCSFGLEDVLQIGVHSPIKQCLSVRDSESNTLSPIVDSLGRRGGGVGGECILQFTGLFIGFHCN